VLFVEKLEFLEEKTTTEILDLSNRVFYFAMGITCFLHMILQPYKSLCNRFRGFRTEEKSLSEKNKCNKKCSDPKYCQKFGKVLEH